MKLSAGQLLATGFSNYFSCGARLILKAFEDEVTSIEFQRSSAYYCKFVAFTRHRSCRIALHRILGLLQCSNFRALLAVINARGTCSQQIFDTLRSPNLSVNLKYFCMWNLRMQFVCPFGPSHILIFFITPTPSVPLSYVGHSSTGRFSARPEWLALITARFSPPLDSRFFFLPHFSLFEWKRHIDFPFKVFNLSFTVW